MVDEITKILKELPTEIINNTIKNMDNRIEELFKKNFYSIDY